MKTICDVSWERSRTISRNVLDMYININASHATSTLINIFIIVCAVISAHEVFAAFRVATWSLVRAHFGQSISSVVALATFLLLVGSLLLRRAVT
jgi:hypothetical protein